MNTFGQIRESLGISRQKMSEVLGVTVMTVWNLENRKYKSGPSPLVMERLEGLRRELPAIRAELEQRSGDDESEAVR